MYENEQQTQEAPRHTIGMEHGECEKAVQVLGKTLEELESRAMPFLRPTVPTALGDNRKDAGLHPIHARSPQAERLASLRNSIDALTRRVEGIIGRIDE